MPLLLISKWLASHRDILPITTLLSSGAKNVLEKPTGNENKPVWDIFSCILFFNVYIHWFFGVLHTRMDHSSHRQWSPELGQIFLYICWSKWLRFPRVNIIAMKFFHLQFFFVLMRNPWGKVDGKIQFVWYYLWVRGFGPSVDTFRSSFAIYETESLST